MVAGVNKTTSQRHQPLVVAGAIAISLLIVAGASAISLLILAGAIAISLLSLAGAIAISLLSLAGAIAIRTLPRRASVRREGGPIEHKVLFHRHGSDGFRK